MEQMNIRLLQSPTVEKKGEEILFPYKKAAGLFYYLCVKKSATREELIHLLWADGSEASGRKSLREALYQIKKKVGEDFLLLSGQSSVRLNPEVPCFVDLDHPEDILEHYKGGFLDHFYVKNCYEFEEWAQETREYYRNCYLEEVRRRLDLAAAAGDESKMDAYTSILLRQDPYNEAFYQQAMGIFAEQGKYSMAIKLYYDLRKRLKEDLDMEPGEDVQEQMQRIFQVKENLMGGSIQREEYFFGRSQEVYRIHNRISALIRGDRALSLVVEGDVGVGKTALMEKVRRMFASHRVLIWSAACYETERGFYLKPWQDIFSQMEDLASQEKMDLRPEEAEIFRNFMRGGSELSGEGVPVSCQMVERTLLELVGRISKKRKILLFLDDIQWMDAMSVQLLQRLLLTYGGQSVLLIAGLRPCEENGFAESMELLLRKDLLERMELRNFTREETGEILEKLLPEIGGSAEQVEEIYRETDGNALFLMELAGEMREKGFTLDIPKKTAGVIGSRLARLSKEENQILDAMSIFIDRGNVEELEILLPWPRLTLLELLEELEKKHLIWENVTGGEVYYSFRHRMYWEYVYGRQSEGKKRHWHMQIGMFYEKDYEKEKSLRFLPLMVYHYERGGNKSKFYQYKLLYLKEFYTFRNENYPVLHEELFSGSSRLRERDGEQAMTSLAREVIRWEDSSRESKALKMESYYILGRYDIAVGDYREGTMAVQTSIRLAGELEDGEYLAGGCKQMIFYGIQVQDLEVMEEYLKQGREALKTYGLASEKVVFDRLEALYLSCKGEYREAEIRLRRILDYYEGLSGSQDLYRMGRVACYNYMGEIYRQQGLFTEACVFYRKALEGSGDGYPVNGVGQLYLNLGQALLAMEELSEAGTCLLRAVECFRYNDYRWGWDRAEACLCLLRLKEGKWEEAKEHLAKADGLAEQIRTPETLRLIGQLKEKLDEQDKHGHK
ncbi:AAA family ATPase [Cuneatibacter sp. NSJ-177]|uniref:AAA family ATPase n=1 Tax=Cuneatibacter sp. NSJ-177 TaxID=2931401 RepID=UPI001FD491B0|nr:AAA family ATPase [Cuneatibacter sp. NSJ-177]MCJ7837185.1 AAA family ATPase [Cuneatibacter sp. NSJ-177]